MPRNQHTEYDAEAYSPSGEVWWKLTFWPGKKQKFGVEPKLAAWLNYNAKVSDVFTMRQFRDVLGDADAPNTQEHFNRRFRALRKYGWIVLSSRDSGDLEPDQYRLTKVGAPIWLGKSKHGARAISEKMRREIFDRDGHRCLVCGVGSGEPYPDDPTRVARLTLGHFVADSLRGPNDPLNLRTECARCNEPVKEHARRSESAAELWPKIRDLSRANKARLFAWIEKGYRDRDAVDVLFDQVRVLPALQREEIRARLQRALQGAS
jgi:5-methylcytosine-specific restriction endonuclease McrA